MDELEIRGMPTELALLPMVESAFNPMAYSRAHASGLWQFIPSTGKNYNLQQNWWYDARRDIIASTNAALDYLQYLYGMYGDWDLALASYNWGENAVSRAIERNKAKGLPTDYLSLNMPTETRQYVPKLQALKNIISHPEIYHLDLGPIPNQPYFVTVRKTRDMDIRVAAKLAEMPVEELLALNPAYNRPVVSTSAGDMLVLPADRAEIFRTNLANHDEPFLSWQAYTFKHGDKLDHIASQHGITLARPEAAERPDRQGCAVHPGIATAAAHQGPRERNPIPVMLPAGPPTPPMAMATRPRPAGQPPAPKPAGPSHRAPHRPARRHAVFHRPALQRERRRFTALEHHRPADDRPEADHPTCRARGGWAKRPRPPTKRPPRSPGRAGAGHIHSALAAHSTPRQHRPRNAQKPNKPSPSTRVAAAKTTTHATRVAKKHSYPTARFAQQAKREVWSPLRLAGNGSLLAISVICSIEIQYRCQQILPLRVGMSCGLR